MGIYNCSATLNEAIDSILGQTYTDWKFIICDDGSSDDSLQIAKSYEAQDPQRFLVIQNPKNMGLNYTLNHCLQYADGEYIARMDGDDISVPDRFEKEVAFLDAHPEYALVSSEMILFDEDGDWGKTSVIKYPKVNDFCTHSPFFCHAACMIRRSVFMEVGGYTVDPRLLRVEDCHLWFKIYAKGYRGANLPDPLYKMRDDRNSVRRRNVRARLNGCYVMFAGFRLLHMPWYKYIYPIGNAVTELLKCVVPNRLYEAIHKRKFQRSDRSA